MRIASWNINSLRKRQDRLFAWLDATKPDIVCLQETKCTDEQFPLLALQASGYRSAYHGEKSYNGVAILAKSEPRNVRLSLCDEVIDPQARVIAATIDKVRVFSVYAPNGQAVGSPANDYKLSWYARLQDSLSKEETAELVAMFTILISGAARSCVLMASGQRSASYTKPVSGTRCDSITKRGVSSLGGIIGCFHFPKIAACGSTRFWRANPWRRNVLRQE